MNAMNTEPNPLWIAEKRISETEKMAGDAVQRSAPTGEYASLWKAIGELKKRQCAFASNKVVLTTLAVNAAIDAPVVFNSPMPDANFVYDVLLTNPVGIALASISVTEKTGSKSAAGLTFTIKNTGVAVLSGSVKLTVLAQAAGE